MLKVCAVFTLLCGLLAPASALSFSTSLSSNTIPDLVNLLQNAAFETTDISTDSAIFLQSISEAILQLRNQLWFNIDSFTVTDMQFRQTGTDGQVSVYMPFNARMDSRIPGIKGKLSVKSAFQIVLQVNKDKNGRERVVLRDCKVPSDNLEINYGTSFGQSKLSSPLVTQAKLILASNLGNQLCQILSVYFEHIPVQLIKQIIKPDSQSEVNISN